jgi:DNA-binding Lrp family transcriptional regulator
MTKVDLGPPLRAIARIVDIWSLDIVNDWYRFFGGDTRKAEICLFIRLANTEYLLDDAVMAARYRNTAVSPADCRPIKIAAIAETLGFDYETVRRKIALLQADGHCLVDDRGVILQLPEEGSPAFIAHPGGLPARLETLVDRLRSLVIENGYDAAAVAELRAALNLDFTRVADADTLVTIIVGQSMARTLFASTTLFGADRDSAAVYLTIYVESERVLAHDPQLSRADGWIDSEMVVGAYQPVTLRGIARCIGLPTETVRRKVNRLVDKQLIKRVPLGLLRVRTPALAQIHAPRVYHHLLTMLAQVETCVALDESNGTVAR